MKNRHGNTSDLAFTDLDPGVAPVSLPDMNIEDDEPEFLGDLDIRIDVDGGWHWDGEPVRRKELICMLAYMLDRDDDGTYWIRTPTEYGRITVEDAPFLGTAVYVSGEGEGTLVSVLTNVDQLITVDANHPLRIATDPATGEPRPYVTVGRGLEARIVRAAFYELADHAHEETVGGERLYGIWSSGDFFALGAAVEEDGP